jgi:hypothetical protein
MDDYDTNMCNSKIISNIIGPVSAVFSARPDQKLYIPKVASNNETHFCTENLDFTCCDSKMLFNAFHKPKFLEGLRQFRGLKGKIIKIFRILRFVESLNYEDRLQKVLKFSETPEYVIDNPGKR